MSSERIIYLTGRFFNKSATAEEESELAKWIMETDNDALKEVLKQAWQRHESPVQMPEDTSDRILSMLFHQDQPAKAAEVPHQITTIRRKKYGYHIAVAATISLAITAAIYLWFNPVAPPPIAKDVPQQKYNDVPPGGNKAILTLANGVTIVLDSASNGLLAAQGNAEIVKLANGELAYTTKGVNSGKVWYNTMSTPAGGQYKLILPDGSAVWLNAASSIRYPAAFGKNERRVEIQGEAYFEIAKDQKKPFIVAISNGPEVKVLGTHFNVNAYSDEETIKTTLLEGAVKITQNNASNLLRPGQQSRVSKNGTMNVVPDVNVEEVVAWKNGYFEYNSADLPTVLRQVARWYDLEIEFAGKIPEDRFTGKIPRTVNLSRLLQWMKWSDIHFKLEGKKIIILS